MVQEGDEKGGGGGHGGKGGHGRVEKKDNGVFLILFLIFFKSFINILFKKNHVSKMFINILFKNPHQLKLMAT